MAQTRIQNNEPSIFRINDWSSYHDLRRHVRQAAINEGRSFESYVGVPRVVQFPLSQVNDYEQDAAAIEAAILQEERGIVERKSTGVFFVPASQTQIDFEAAFLGGSVGA